MLAVGAAIAVAALAVAWGVAPWLRRVRERALLLGVERARVERLAALAAARDSLSRVADSLDAAPPGSRGPVAAPDAALGASALQEALQSLADAAGVRVARLDVSGVPGTRDGVTVLPAALEAQGDIHGVAALVAALRHGPLALDLRELSATVSPVSTHAGRPLLDVAVALAAPLSEGRIPGAVGAWGGPAPLAAAIVASDPFHPSRRPPGGRYRPGPSGDPAAVAASDLADGGDVPRLLGIVRGPGGPRALIRLDPARGDAQLYAVGGGDAGYRVVAIGADRVTLTGPGGRVELVLPPPEVR